LRIKLGGGETGQVNLQIYFFADFQPTMNLCNYIVSPNEPALEEKFTHCVFSNYNNVHVLFNYQIK
jgi:hypothetical protein